jgi:hypothetical protein
LVASSVGTDQLLGGPGVKPVSVDALVARVLVKGEPLAAPAGRADDFAWPRREIGREQAKGDVPVAAATPGASGTSGTVGAPGPDGIVPVMAPPTAAKKKPKPVIATEVPSSSFGSFFGFDDAPRRAPIQQAPQRSRPALPSGPRPPANVGPAASAPSGFFTR